MKKLIELYTQWAHEEPIEIEKIEGAGSNRCYYRFTNAVGISVIGVIGTSIDENNAFIYLTHHFTYQKLPVPKILAVSNDKLRYLQTDLGKTSLYALLKDTREAGGQYTQQEKKILLRTIRILPDIQVQGAHGLDFQYCYPQPEFDVNSVLFDLNYFKYCFLKATNIDFHELKLEANFRLFAKDLTSEPSEYFLFRDFQARNVMIDNQGNPYFIDYQGGRKGPIYYDLASFLWQASAKYPFKLRRELAMAYYDSLKRYIEVPTARHFVDRLSLFILFRTLQVLGAYGFRGYFEGKEHFINSIPDAIQNLRELLTFKGISNKYPYLLDVLKHIIELPQFKRNVFLEEQHTDSYKVDKSSVYHTNSKEVNYFVGKRGSEEIIRTYL